MRITLRGTRGSLPTPGPETARYGGNTSCVQVVGPAGSVLCLDAGTGIRTIGIQLPSIKRVDVLITHLHMDHIQGLGFFTPLYNPSVEVHIWGPASTTMSLRTRLSRYMSPPLFPVRLRDLRCTLELHEVEYDSFAINEFTVRSALVCHPGPTVGYRVETSDGTVTYLPDHEVALGTKDFPLGKEWTSGYDLAEGVDLLMHDAQYTSEEYLRRVGWGHSSLDHLFAFAELVGVKHLVPFHHDPAHDDKLLDALFADFSRKKKPKFRVTPATEGSSFTLPE